MSSQHPLDNAKTFAKYDSGDIAFGIEGLTRQIEQALEGAAFVKVSGSQKGVTRVLIAGMGGSSLAGHMIQTSLADKLKVSIELLRGYELPQWVDGKTLVILSSFSGTTEEVLYVAEQARKRCAKIAVVASGGPLAQMAKKQKYTSFIFEPGNLAKEPRLGLGFMMIGTLALLEAYGLIKLTRSEKEMMMQAMSEVVDTCAIDVPAKENPAKEVAQALKGRPVMFVAAQHLVGCAHVLQNQVNETAKQFAVYYELPELNHHLMEGLTYPAGFFKKFVVVLLKSKFYHPSVQKRVPITADVFEKLGAEVVEYEARGSGRLEEAMELLQFGSFTSYYLAMLNRVDPKEIPYVNWFKAELKKK